MEESLPPVEDLRQRTKSLSSDLFCEVLSRVDAVTLAMASCVSSEFRRVCEDEVFWERLCNLRWPSTKEAAVREIISHIGGFRNFYANCHPCISGKGSTRGEYFEKCSLRLFCSQNKLENEEVCLSDFQSIIDVMYNGQPMLSRTVEGFLGAEESRDWFENCPFQFDLLEAPDEIDGLRKDEEGITAVAMQTELPAITSIEKERKYGCLWKSLNDNLRVSWILINKKTQQMANLASWKPVGGLRHWPSDEDYVLHFGTIVPGIRSLPNGAIYCNISIKVRFSTMETVKGCRTTVGITEFGMKLENIEGARLYGMESVEILSKALSCERTVCYPTVVDSYQDFGSKQIARRAEKIRQENQRELAAALISGIGAFLCLCYVLL